MYMVILGAYKRFSKNTVIISLQFIYPVPRNEGYELMVGEFLEDQFYLTSVINYQVRREVFCSKS